MLTINKPIYDHKAYMYGATAMVLCSVGAVSTIAWGGSLKDRPVSDTSTKPTSVVQNAADKEQPKPTDSPADTQEHNDSKVSATTPDVSTTSPAIRALQTPASSKPTPVATPKATPTPSPISTPAPTPTTEPLPAPDPTDPMTTMPTGP